MKIETQPLEDHQVKLVVEVETQPFEQAKRRAASRLSRRTKIPGFRPGKAPYHIVQRHIGEEAILDESLDILLKDLYPQIIEEAEIDPHGPGKLENIVNMDPLKLEFVVPLAAEVALGDYSSVRYPYEPEVITDEDVEQVLKDLRHRQAVDEPVERPAQESDHVFISLSAEQAIVEEGKEATLIAERPQSLIIAAEDEDNQKEWPFSGFSRELIGMSPEDEKTLTHAFPEDVEFENLRGATALLTVKMEEVKSRTLPELDDNFAQSIGEYKTLEDLRVDVRASLERQTQEAYDDDYDEKILSEIIAGSTIKYSPQMLEEEKDEVIHQLEHRLQSQNLDLDTYLMTREMNEDELREEVEPVAQTRLERSLVLFEIGEQENIEIPPEDVQAEAERALDVLSRSMSDEDIQKISTQELIPNLVSNIMVDMKIKRTLERVRAIARGDSAQDDRAKRESAEGLTEEVETEGEATPDDSGAGSETLVAEVVEVQPEEALADVPAGVGDTETKVEAEMEEDILQPSSENSEGEQNAASQ